MVFSLHWDTLPHFVPSVNLFFIFGLCFHLEELIGVNSSFFSNLINIHVNVQKYCKRIWLMENTPKGLKRYFFKKGKRNLPWKFYVGIWSETQFLGVLFFFVSCLTFHSACAFFSLFSPLIFLEYTHNSTSHWLAPAFEFTGLICVVYCSSCST